MNWEAEKEMAEDVEQNAEMYGALADNNSKMAEQETLTLHYNRKVQLDDFEPVQHGAEMEVTLEDGDDPEEVHEEQSELLEDMVERALAHRVSQKKMEEGEAG